MALSAVIDSFITGTYVVTRGSAGSRSTGVWVPGATSPVNVDACVQPLTGRELQFLPEGLRGQEVVKVYTKTQLYTVRDGIDADSIAIGGEAYTIVSVKSWSAFGGDASGDHYECLAARVPAP